MCSKTPITYKHIYLCKHRVEDKKVTMYRSFGHFAEASTAAKASAQVCRSFGFGNNCQWKLKFCYIQPSEEER